MRIKRPEINFAGRLRVGMAIAVALGLMVTVLNICSEFSAEASGKAYTVHQA
ncbi:MAG TPA: hypothetical protein VGP06_01295 [Janthinobacterium sp.]|jgi:hypothetical protein|nr:hypothetical protein [Janthinobacterium sp.]